MPPDGTTATQEAASASETEHRTALPAGFGGAAPDAVDLAALPPADTAFDDFERFKDELFSLVERPGSIRSSEPLSPAWSFRRLFRGHRDEDASYSELVAHYAALWPLLEQPENRRYSAQTLLGLEFLKTGRLQEASAIVNNVEFQISTPKALSYVMRGVGSFMRIGIILGFFVAYAALGISLFPGGTARITSLLQDIDPKAYSVLVAALSGMLGSIVSILLRIAEFESTRGRSKSFLELTGATLPLVGGAFGAVIAALLAANIVNISFGNVPGGNIWLYVVVGFLSGFSERFSRSFLNMAESRLAAAADRPPEGGPGGRAASSDAGANARINAANRPRRPR